MPPSGSAGRRGPGASAGRGAGGRDRPTERLARRSGAPFLAPAAIAAAAAGALWLGWGRLATLGASLEAPETQIRKALAHQDRAHLSDVYGFHGGGTVELYPVRFSDVTPLAEPGRATVVAMLSAEGRVAWRDEQARLAYVGREEFHMRPCAIALWCGEGDQFDRLRGVLLALFRHHDALRGGDAEACARLVADGYRDGAEDRAAAVRRLALELPRRPRAVRVVAWQIRVDRAAAEVGEDVEVDGSPGARRERHLYRLAREHDRWVFTAGL